ncbi:unnamed protein product, partial [Mesorhabditis belari]|uniref:MTOR-associated protein MEAK7 n=1 Tax=Mesorhabditis belari TaxID=2138241 RepID=A0AAF3F3N6_9BILA
MNFFRKHFTSEQKESSTPRVSNLDTNQRDLIWKRVNDTSNKGTIERTKFLELYQQLAPITERLYVHLNGKHGKVTPQSVLSLADQLHGDCEEIVTTLLEIYSDLKTVLSSLVDCLATRKNLSLSEKEKVQRYLVDDAPSDSSRFGRWLHANPLMLPLIRFIFAPLYFESTDRYDLYPKLSTTSDILQMSALIAINANLPMERRKDWTLLFSTNRQGASFSQLSQKIDAQGPCLLVVESREGHVFGCFASDGFFTGPLFHGDATSFLFAASPEIKISNATGHVKNYAYMNYQQQQMPNGIGLGGYETVWPFFIHEEFGRGQCARHVASFEKIDLCDGSSEFSIKSIEAWRCGEKPRNFNPDGEEPTTPHAHKSVLDIDPQAKAILEMSGRKMHSEAYRDPEPMLD